MQLHKIRCLLHLMVGRGGVKDQMEVIKNYFYLPLCKSWGHAWVSSEIHHLFWWWYFLGKKRGREFKNGGDKIPTPLSLNPSPIPPFHSGSSTLPILLCPLILHYRLPPTNTRPCCWLAGIGVLGGPLHSASAPCCFQQRSGCMLYSAVFCRL